MIELRIDENTTVLLEQVSAITTSPSLLEGRHGPSAEVGIKDQAQKVVADLREIAITVGTMIARLRENALEGLGALQPDEFEIAFEFGVDFEKNVVIAKGGLSSSFNVTAKWCKASGTP